MTDNSKTYYNSKKRGANILCRVANASPQKVCEYVNMLPKTIIPCDQFRKLMGNDWFNNIHQAPEQWGLYYIDEKYYYPRFNRNITLKEASIYLHGWMKRFPVINPYTRFKVTNDNNLILSIIQQIETEPDERNLKNIIKKIIGENVPFVLNEILVNAINDFSEVIRINTIDKSQDQYQVELVKNYKEILNEKYYMNKKEYFELFNGISSNFDPRSAKQIIYYGAPGTGKSHTINKITKDWDVIRTTFHPDSDYSTFVGAYKPTVEMLSICDEAGQPVKISNIELQKKQITYKFVRQAFLNAYLSAWKKYAKAKDGEVEPQFLIIEEINRGNCAQIFGDIFQLLDRADNGFSTYPIVADSDISKSIEEAFKNEEKFKIDSLSIEGAVRNYNSNLSVDVREGRILLLPPNLYIWATMNTSDQSLFPIDSAFKRRWDWKYIKITNAFEKDDSGNYKTDEKGKKIPLGWKIKINDNYEKDWWEFLEKINAIISNMTSSADKQLGYFFCKADENKEISAEKFVSKVVFYLWNDVFKDYGFEDSSLFLVKKNDENGKEIDKDLTYPDFFDEDGNVDVEITKQFIDNVMSWSKKNENNL